MGAGGGAAFGQAWKKLNFSSLIQQGDFNHRGEQGIFESVGFRLFQLAGVPAENTSFAHFRIIERAGPSRALAVTFAIPVFAVLYGVVLLMGCDKTTPGTVMGATSP